MRCHYRKFFAPTLIGILVLDGISASAVMQLSPMRGKILLRAVVNFAALARQERSMPQAPSHHWVAPDPLPLRNYNHICYLLAGKPQRPFIPSSTRAWQPPQSPGTATSFEALLDNDTMIPPDTMGAVSPNQVVTTLNSQIQVQDRNGQIVDSWLNLQDFWSSSVPGITEVFDPRLTYDPYDGRWIFIVGANPNSITSSLLIAVSQTDDFTGNWNIYEYTPQYSYYEYWKDFPMVGFNKNWIVVTANLFDINTNQNYGSEILTFDKSEMMLGESASYSKFYDQSGSSICPAVTYDNNISTEYLLENESGDSYGVGMLQMSTITGTPDYPVWTADSSDPSVLAPWNDRTYDNFAPQLGSIYGIETNDSRISSCVYRNGSIWAAQTVFLPADFPTRSSVQWWQISPIGTVDQFGRIDDPSNLYYYAYPSIAVNQNNDVLVGYSIFSSTQYAGAGYSLHLAGDPPDTMELPTVLKSGEAPYYKTFGHNKNRWGDYSATVVDPTNDTDFWTIQEYAASPDIFSGDDLWGTWWGQVVLDYQVTTSVTPTNVLQGTAATGSVSIQPAAPNGGAVINLSSDTPASATVPATVTIPAGQTSASFTITTEPFNTTTSVNITGSYLDNSGSSSLTVWAPISSLSVNPSDEMSLFAATGTVNLPGPAPLGGATITLTSSDPSIASVPSSVTIPGGQGSATFSIPTGFVADSTQVTITASYGLSTEKTTLTVLPWPWWIVW